MSRLTGVGFLAVGLIGFIVKVIFIPINQVGVPTNACMLILLGWARGAPYQPAMVNRPASWVWCDDRDCSILFLLMPCASCCSLYGVACRSSSEPQLAHRHNCSSRHNCGTVTSNKPTPCRYLLPWSGHAHACRPLPRVATQLSLVNTNNADVNS